MGLTDPWSSQPLYNSHRMELLRLSDILNNHGLVRPIINFRNMVKIDDNDMTITIDRDAMLQAGYRVKNV